VSDLDRVRAALEQIVGSPVEVLSREVWESSLRAGGEPTRLPRPFEPYLGVQGAPGFEYTVASGAPHADEPGFHHVRRDEKDAATGGLFNTDSHVVIVDLVADPRWAEILRFSGLEGTDELVALVRAYIFAYARRRDDHWSDTIPSDIAGAEPKGTDPPSS